MTFVFFFSNFHWLFNLIHDSCMNSHFSFFFGQEPFGRWEQVLDVHKKTLKVHASNLLVSGLFIKNHLKLPVTAACCLPIPTHPIHIHNTKFHSFVLVFMITTPWWIFSIQIQISLSLLKVKNEKKKMRNWINKWNSLISYSIINENKNNNNFFLSKWFQSRYKSLESFCWFWCIHFLLESDFAFCFFGYNRIGHLQNY